jgi:hypothetical protein
LSEVETIMTATFKFIATLLVPLAGWTGQVLADQAPPPEVEKPTLSMCTNIESIQAPDRLAWQRVGSPMTLEG